MEKLASDIVLEILSRLPKTNTGFKSGLQCREVCRLWRNLLGKPKKGMLFVTWDGYESRLYYREKSSEMVNFSCIEEPQNFHKMVTEISSIETGFWCYSFVGTCNSLVCYVITKSIFIYNPITGECICIPNFGYVPNIGSDPSAYGFGYCRSTKTYKVVKIGESYDAKQTVNVYTLGDGSWWRYKPAVTFGLLGSGVFANGCLHWLINKSSNYDIVAFDLADETFRYLPSPPCQNKSVWDVDIGSCGANLYLSYFYVKEGESMMDIWVFEKKNMKNCRRSLYDRTYFNYFTWIRRFSRKCDHEGLTRLLSRTESEILLLQHNVLSSYDPATFKKIWSAEAAEGVHQAIPHMHSLVSLKDLGEQPADHYVLPKMEVCWL